MNKPIGKHFVQLKGFSKTLESKLYRYTVNNQGLYETVKSELFYIYGYNNKPWKMIQQASSWLPLPEVYANANSKLKSYFTELGNRKFQETVLPIITYYLPHLHIKCKVTNKSNLSSVVYKDKYQLVEKCVHKGNDYE